MDRPGCAAAGSSVSVLIAVLRSVLCLSSCSKMNLPECCHSIHSGLSRLHLFRYSLGAAAGVNTDRNKVNAVEFFFFFFLPTPFSAVLASTAVFLSRIMRGGFGRPFPSSTSFESTFVYSRNNRFPPLVPLLYVLLLYCAKKNAQCTKSLTHDLAVRRFRG